MKLDFFKLDQKKVAKRLRTDPSYISHVMRGARKAGALRRRIQHVTGLSPTEFNTLVDLYSKHKSA